MAVLVVHTTETPAGTAESVARQLLARGAAPHQVYDPDTGTVVHCIDWDRSAKALFNAKGGVETNRRGGVYQVEIVGYAGQVPHYNDGWYRNLGAYLSTVCDETGVPKVFPCGFINGGFGVHAPQRLSHQAWLNVAGVIGHQHVPENDHWDPGGLDVTRLGMGDDMTPEQALQLAQVHRFLFAGLDPNVDNGGYALLSMNHTVQNVIPQRLDQLGAAMPSALDLEHLADAIVARLPATGGSVVAGPSVEQIKQAMLEVLRR